MVVFVFLLVLIAIILCCCLKGRNGSRTKPYNSPKGSKKGSPFNSSKKQLGLVVYNKKDGSVIEKDKKFDSKGATESPFSKRSKDALPDINRKKPPVFDSRDPSRNKDFDTSFERKKQWGAP